MNPRWPILFHRIRERGQNIIQSMHHFAPSGHTACANPDFFLAEFSDRINKKRRLLFIQFEPPFASVCNVARSGHGCQRLPEQSDFASANFCDFFDRKRPFALHRGKDAGFIEDVNHGKERGAGDELTEASGEWRRGGRGGFCIAHFGGDSGAV